MNPEIKTLTEKKLIGKRIIMSFAENKTFELWRSFMPRRNEIINPISYDLFSIQLYDSSFNFNESDLHKTFEKWAAVEVSDFDIIPDGMETFTLQNGLYAIFYYKGLNTDTRIFQTIFGTWLPNSEYVLDARPHFEILGEKHKNNDPNSEEEIWIPIKIRA